MNARGYFADLETLTKRAKLSVGDLVAGTGLNEKTVRRMLNGKQPSSKSSIDKLMDFLEKKSIAFNRKTRFIELED